MRVCFKNDYSTKGWTNSGHTPLKINVGHKASIRSFSKKCGQVLQNNERRTSQNIRNTNKIPEDTNINTNNTNYQKCITYYLPRVRFAAKDVDQIGHGDGARAFHVKVLEGSPHVVLSNKKIAINRRCQEFLRARGGKGRG